MIHSSTFSTLSTVRLGIYAAQKGLEVTGNNITNINTEGYTRQRLDQSSLITSSNDMYMSPTSARVGAGVVVTGVSQIRDPSLDIAFRQVSADVGQADSKLAGLEDLAVILDEIGKGDGEQDDGVILSQLNDLRDLISQANTNGIDGYDSIIRTSAGALASLFNSYAYKLDELEKTALTAIEQDVDSMNQILEDIHNLNISIRNSDIRGDEALELRDQRNMLIDELAQHNRITAEYSMEDIGAGVMIEKLTIKFDMGEDGTHTMIDGEFYSQLSIETDPTSADYMDVTAAALIDHNDDTFPGSTDYTFGDNQLYGSLQAQREMLTEKGEYATAADIAIDSDASIKRGIPYYQMALDGLAHEFAFQMNALNNPGTGVDGEGNLFSNAGNSNDATGITASNISVSQAWANGDVSMIPSTDPMASSGDTSNLSQFLYLFDKEHEFDPDDINTGADGAPIMSTFEDFLIDMQATLAEDQMATTAVLNNHMLTASDIHTARESVSGVDLNDEATGLMVYQKAYVAASRLMTVIDEVLNALLSVK